MVKENDFMEITLQDRLDKLLKAYAHSYDIDPEAAVSGGFPAAATFYLRDENYLFSRQKVLSAVEQHEYVYFYLTQTLDAQELQEQIRRSQEVGLARIHPHREHMCSYVTLVILADRITPEAQSLLRKTRLRKNFRLALHGWMEYRIAAMECSSNSFFSNPAGKEAKKILEMNFTTGKSQKKGEYQQ